MIEPNAAAPLARMVASGNADPAELAKFSALAHRWWDPQSEFKPLHDINPLRVRWVDAARGRLAGQARRRRRLRRRHLRRSARASRRAGDGDRPFREGIGVARLHQYESGTNVDYRLVAAETLALEMPAAFDVVTCLELLEHVPEPASTVAACGALAKSGGLVVFSTLNRNPKSYAQAILGAEYVLRLLPRGTHDWTRFLRPSELAGFGRRAQLALVAMTGMSYNPLTRTYRLSGDTSVNYLAAYRRLPRDG